MAHVPSYLTDPPIPVKQIQFDRGRGPEIQAMGPSTGPMAMGLGVARVVRVDAATHELVLQILSGENDLYQRTAVPNIYAAAGARHGIVALPEPGDICVVGWLATSNKTPIILGWVPISVAAGLEWLPVQDFLPAEADWNPKRQTEYAGIYARRRFKMRPMAQGNIFLSSSQGSDVFLDEGVTISNRRLNEIRLRDQDQAYLLRAVGSFQTLGGSRIYTGPVQRDVLLLHPRVVQDGVRWEAGAQTQGVDPLPHTSLGRDEVGKFRPHPTFQKSDPSSPFFDSGIEVDANLDPYSILSKGLWIGPDGFVNDPTKVTSDAEYGGKSFFRVAQARDPSGQTLNAALGGEALTEHRVEICHSTNGTLPCNEETEGLDVDGLSQTPYLEWVLGSVVGNHPFLPTERPLYGVPLLPRIFDGDAVDPRLESGIGVEIQKHAATLLRITPPLQASPPMFASLTKDGAARVFLTGPAQEDSLEMALRGGLRLEAGGPVRLKGRSIEFDLSEGDPASNRAFGIKSQTGSITLSAGGPSTLGTASARGASSLVKESALPALVLEAPTSNTWVTAGKDVKIAAGGTIAVGDAQGISISAKQNVRIYTDKLVTQTNTLDRTVQGKETTLYVGPKSGLPSNGPAREVTFGGTPATGQVGGVVDEYTVIFGDRKETFRLGDHTTQILVGDMTYETGLGTWKAKAGLNSLSVSSTGGIDGNAVVGSVSLQSTTTAAIRGLLGVTVRTGGVARLSGATVILGGSGGTGGIVNGSDIDPMTNLPLSVLGMGSAGHLLGPPI